MCGVIGLLLKDTDLEPQLGSMLVPMLEALSDRGPDSSGIAVYADADPCEAGAGVGSSPSGSSVSSPRPFRISLGSDRALEWASVGADLISRFPSHLAVRTFAAGAVVESDQPDDVVEVLRLEWPDVRVVGSGRSVSVVKDTGLPRATCIRYGIERWHGYLAVAHTRMATESAVTVLHSHPFVPAPDLCVVHNGSFSNYASVRRRLEADGVSFDSDNDSEVAARFLATRLAAGDDLEEATRWVMKEMDGFFTMVITTDTAMSVVRDAFACKPAVVAETSRYVAVASEYRALAELPGIADAHVFEPQPEEVYTWTR
jgi:glutamate synthase domain-containing protein 1